MKKIVITGGTGTIGKKLTQKLLLLGYEVIVLTRNPKEKNHRFWDFENRKIDEDSLKNVYALVHLAGANIGEKPWTKDRKLELIESRVQSLNFLYDEFKKTNQFPAVLVSSSGTGFYDSKIKDMVYKESDQNANDFLGKLCFEWEKSALRFKGKTTRTVVYRTGVVLSNEKNGALQKMLLPFKFGLGSALASGKQYLPWIHLEDIVQLYVTAVENHTFEGVFNAAAPEQVTNLEFSKQLAKSLNKPFFLPAIPRFLLRLVFGEMEQIITQGSRVSSEKILSSGYFFKFPSLEKAFEDLLK